MALPLVLVLEEIPLKVTNLIHRMGLLQATLTVDAQGASSSGHKLYCSPEYIIEGTTQIKMQIFVEKTSVSNNHRGYYGYEYKFIFRLLVKKIDKTDALKTKILFSCKEIKIQNQPVSSEDGCYHIFEHENRNDSITFNVTLNTEVIDASGSIASLYDDTDLTDFELHCEDGSVPVHKFVLAACSPVFKRMLAGDWKETSSGQVNIPGTSVGTIQYLKSYMYLRKMPSSGFEELLLLAAYYMMPGLERRCIEKLVSAMNPQNTLKLCEFAVRNKMDKLHLSLLESIQAGTVKVADIRIANISAAK